MGFQDFKTSAWYSFLEPQAQTLVLQTHELVDREKRLRSSFDDYAFILFPMAKAYESFLKKFVFEMGLIDRNQYEGKQFRIGRSLNPDVSLHQRDEFWLFDNIVASCGEKTARELWDTWLVCRNHLFHYFPQEKSTISFDKALSLLEMMNSVMEEALACSKHRRYQ